MYAHILSLSLALLVTLPAHALPPEVEADRLAIKAKTALETKDYPLASASLAEMEKLGVPLPQSFHYLKGVAQNSNGKYYAARESLEKYLQITGNTGKFYKEALEAYNRAEQEGQRLIAEYKTAQVRHEAALAAREESINNCYSQDMRRYNRWLQDYRDIDHRANRCSKSCWLDCSPCQRLWAERDRVIEKSVDEPDKYECEKRYSEPKPPLPPVLY